MIKRMHKQGEKNIHYETFNTRNNKKIVGREKGGCRWVEREREKKEEVGRENKMSSSLNMLRPLSL